MSETVFNNAQNPENGAGNGRALENAGAEAFVLVERRRRRRTHRRLGIWGGFLLLGLLLGTIYATGFATTGATGTGAKPANVNNSPALNADTADLSGKVTTVTTPLSYSWTGRWGSVTPSAVMYEINLSSYAIGEKFFSEVVLSNTPTGFSDLQLQLRIATPAAASCAVSDLTITATTNYRVMVFDTVDAQVTFSGMAGATTGLLGGSKYCIGIVNYTGPPDAGKDTGGTFIRKALAGATFSGAYPEFIATLNRMS